MLYSGRTQSETPVLPVSALVECMANIPDQEKAVVRRLFELVKTDRLEDARKLYQQTPGLDERFYDWGAAFQREESLDKAMGLYRQTLDLDPTNTRIINAIGAIFHRRGDLGRAKTCYQHAIEIDSDFIPALLNLSRLRLLEGNWLLAEQVAAKILKNQPHHLHALEIILDICMNTCRWQELEKYTQQFWQAAEQCLQKGEFCNLSLMKLFALPLNAHQLQLLQENHAQSITDKMSVQREKLNFSSRYQARPTKRRIRIGYVSPDFRDHPVGNLMWRLFELHDRKVFDVYGYSLGPDEKSEYRRKFSKDFDVFRDMQKQTPAEIACQVYADGIDILVDLGGYTMHTKPEIFALKPAPLQVYYLGWAGNMNAEFIDYFITDQVFTPPQLEGCVTEACMFIPPSCMLSNNQQPIVDGKSRRSDWDVPEDVFIFSAFNRINKVNQELFTTWMNILKQVPDSILWLLPTYKLTMTNIQQEAKDQGVDPQRIVFADYGTCPTKELYLTRQACADLFLDTTHFSGNVSVSNALWAGVPVVACAGDTHAARMSATLLHSAGMGHMVTANLAEYESMAIKLAGDADELKRLRQHLVGNRMNLALFDTRKAVKNLERGFEQMWSNHKAGKQPARMIIPEIDAH